MDGEIIEALMYHMRENRVTFRSGESVERVERDPRGRRDRLSQEPQDPPGRRAPLRRWAVRATRPALKLEAAGLEADDRGRLHVDD